ncbi:MAG: hypothetical protein V1492_01930 [Candidatus Micrarchaeota archaeon]
MKNTFVIFSFVVIAALLISGCILPPPMSDAVPKDLEITYSYGACHAEWGRTNIRIDATGNGIYESGRGMLLPNNRMAEEKFYKTFRMNETELLSLLNTIEKSGFYSLQDSYSDTLIMDGSCEYISVTKNNVTKSVSVSNTQPPDAYATAADAINAVAEAKTK